MPSHDPGKEQSMVINDPVSLKEIAPQNRVLLLPHCLRLSQRCTARYDREEGLLCKNCTQDCPINQLKTAAKERGFGSVCIAPGGSMAVRYLETHRPRGIVAVACGRELEMGVRAVASLSDNGNNPTEMVLYTIPLCQDGCVDTRVDLGAVLEVINL